MKDLKIIEDYRKSYEIIWQQCNLTMDKKNEITGRVNIIRTEEDYDLLMAQKIRAELGNERCQCVYLILFDQSVESGEMFFKVRNEEGEFLKIFKKFPKDEKVTIIHIGTLGKGGLKNSEYWI